MTTTQSQQRDLRDFFLSKNLIVADTWLSSLLQHLSTQDLAPRTRSEWENQALKHFLKSNIRQSLASSSAKLPDSGTEQGTVANIVVQVVECFEIGYSLLNQLERLDAYEERLKPPNRRVIRLTDQEDGQGEEEGGGGGNGDEQQQRGTGRDPVSVSDDDRGLVGKKMVKVVLEDCHGARLYGLEQKPIDVLRVGMNLGAKLILINAQVIHGVLILKPTRLEWLGGRIDVWNENNTAKGLRAELLARLRLLPVMTAQQRAIAQVNNDEEDMPGDNVENTAAWSHQGRSRGRGRGRGRATATGSSRGRAARARGGGRQ